MTYDSSWVLPSWYSQHIQLGPIVCLDLGAALEAYATELITCDSYRVRTRPDVVLIRSLKGGVSTSCTVPCSPPNIYDRMN